MARLDEVLAEAVGLPLRDVVAELVGPIGNRSQEREKQAAERAELWEWLGRSDVVVSQPALRSWVETVRKNRLVEGSAERTKALLERVLEVLAELPATGESLPVLAQRTLHGALSGGEKAIRCSRRWRPTTRRCPRVILLDEVLVGVDSSNPGQVFALLSALDLDLMLTSDHEWCTYAELGGIAIHQLITGGGDNAVTIARFVWNGQDLLPDS